MAIVVPVHDGAETLPTLFDALDRVDRIREAEIVIVDDRSRVGSAEIARARGFRVVERALRGGAAAGRNTGARSTRAPILLFLDADTAPPPDTLARVVEPFEAEDVVAVVGVYARRPLNDGFWPRYKAVQAESYHRHSPVTVISWIWGSMSAVRRDAFDEAGGFDERYAGADLEDVELGRRLSQLGRVVLERRFVVGHHFPETLGANVRNHFERGRHWARLYVESGRFDNYLTTRRMAASRVAAAMLALGFPIALLAGGAIPRIVPIAGLLAYLALTRELMVLAWREGGVRFAAAVLIAETVLSCALIAAGASVACERLATAIGFSASAPGRSGSDCASR